MIADLTPVLVAIVTIAGAAITYVVQKGLDRRNALVELRRRCYRDYLLAFSAMSNSPEKIEDVTRKYFQAEFDILVVGSDEVVQAVGVLSQFYAETNEDRFNRDAAAVRRLVAEVCRAMRRDCFERSSLTVEEIQAVVPIV
jgi:methionine synthase I (cobalamin-dependent)